MNGQNKYNDFWNWFVNNNELIFNFENDEENIFDLLSDELHKIDENLTFEFGPVENNRREFILSADGIKDSFIEVEELYNQKPELKNWIIIKFRPRKGCNYGIKINDISLSPKDIFYKLYKDDSKIGILIFIEKYNENTKIYDQLVYLLLDTILGEYDVETKVGGIDIFDFSSEYFLNSFPFDTLAENFDMFYKKIFE
jgi:hypothetical protein